MENMITTKMNIYNETILELFWNHKIKLLIFVLFTFIGYIHIPYLNKLKKKYEYKDIHKDKFIELQDLKNKKFNKIIDVRSKEEYNQGHVNNSINIDHNDILSSKGMEILKQNNVTPNDRILIYCKSGNRANQVVNYMIENLNYNKKNIYLTNETYDKIESNLN